MWLHTVQFGWAIGNEWRAVVWTRISISLNRVIDTRSGISLVWHFLIVNIFRGSRRFKKRESRCFSRSFFLPFFDHFICDLSWFDDRQWLNGAWTDSDQHKLIIINQMRPSKNLPHLLFARFFSLSFLRYFYPREFVRFITVCHMWCFRIHRFYY